MKIEMKRKQIKKILKTTKETEKRKGNPAFN